MNYLYICFAINFSMLSIYAAEKIGVETYRHAVELLQNKSAEAASELRVLESKVCDAGEKVFRASLDALIEKHNISDIFSRDLVNYMIRSKGKRDSAARKRKRCENAHATLQQEDVDWKDKYKKLEVEYQALLGRHKSNIAFLRQHLPLAQDNPKLELERQIMSGASHDVSVGVEEQESDLEELVIDVPSDDE